MNQKLKIQGEFHIETRTKEGKVLYQETKKNLIVTTGLDEVAKLLTGVDTTYFRAIAIGEGDTAPVIGNTTLEDEKARDSVAGTYEATGKAIFENLFEFGSEESYLISEACILNNATSGGQMLNRVTFTAQTVDVDIDLFIKFTITVS